MRRIFIAGNWKMNLNREQSVALARGIAEKVGPKSDIEVAVCPPSVYIDCVSSVVSGTAVGLGAQDVYHEAEGAFTGEVSTAMLVDLGCQYVILGHSERRNILGETSEMVNQKARAALQAKLTPIVCVGELLEQREAGQTMAVIQQQFDGSFEGLSEQEMGQVVIAYEPVWAIGTGKVATPAQAEEVHLELRTLLEKRYNAKLAEKVRIQYGGSVKPENAGELLSQPNIDGALVGGASLKAEAFLGIMAAA
jgi:triosephosphate isomerase